ncbi:unnamed protein product, partial [marine sediment metagenome]
DKNVERGSKAQDNEELNTTKNTLCHKFIMRET